MSRIVAIALGLSARQVHAKLWTVTLAVILVSIAQAPTWGG